MRSRPEGPEGQGGLEEGPAAVPMSDDGDTYQRFRMQFDCVNFQQNPERCNSNDANSNTEIVTEELHAKVLDAQ